MVGFRILHISDVHFEGEATSAWVERQKILDRISAENLHADCLVISGDLFHRGSLNKEQATRCCEHIGQIKNLLGAEHVLVVPGNHDLDRLARYKKAAQYNGFDTRRELVCEAGQNIKREGGEYRIGDEIARKCALYSAAFADFERFSAVLGSASYNNPDAELTPENYEVQKVTIPKVTIPFDDNPAYGVRFVLLNTALFAGQAVWGEKFRKHVRTLENEKKAAEGRGETVEAARLALEIAKMRSSFEDYGEIIVDEEKESRLGLSKEGNELLSQAAFDTAEDACQAVTTIFVGHHGFNYLSDETQKALKTAMERCQSGLYLCGHAHLARYSRFDLHRRSEPLAVQQVQAGVMFHDSGEYAQYGFNYIEIAVSQRSDNGYVESHYLEMAPSLEPVWRKERLFDLPKPMIEARASNTNEPVVIENTVRREPESEHKPENSFSEERNDCLKSTADPVSPRSIANAVPNVITDDGTLKKEHMQHTMRDIFDMLKRKEGRKYE